MRRIFQFSGVVFILIMMMTVVAGFLYPQPVAAKTIAKTDVLPESSLAPVETISYTTAFTAYVFLPLVLNGYPPAPPTPTCPTTSNNSYDLIPVPGAPADRADYVHADLNLSLRGWETVGGVPLSLQSFWGVTDGDPPQMKGIFTDNRVPQFTSAQQMYDWNWGCTNDINNDGNNDGCRGSLLPSYDGTGQHWDVTLLGMQTTKGEVLRIPSRSQDIYQGNYRALVLYAEETRMTIVYLREDTIAHGYAVHFEDICTDPNLLALYRSRVDANGWRISTGGYQLPGLDNGQPLGTALGTEIKVAIRDKGQFMDPRSQKDWWQ